MGGPKCERPPSWQGGGGGLSLTPSLPLSSLVSLSLSPPLFSLSLPPLSLPPLSLWLPSAVWARGAARAPSVLSLLPLTLSCPCCVRAYVRVSASASACGGGGVRSGACLSHPPTRSSVPTSMEISISMSSSSPPDRRPISSISMMAQVRTARALLAGGTAPASGRNQPVTRSQFAREAVAMCP